MSSVGARRIDEAKDALEPMAIELGGGSSSGAKSAAPTMDKIVSTMPTGTANPVTSFAWREISFFYPRKGGALAALKKSQQTNQPEKPSLDKVSGHCDAGTMVAVIGASGAGKSTLLDILARRFNKGRLEGQMLVNGKQISDDDFKEISGYVPQEDVFVPTQTAYEALMFIANLKLGPKVTKEQKEKLVQTLAGDAGLAHRLHVRIGGVIQGGMRLKGMSGGEKRRLALVACAVTNPSIMFLDEPTSGLDSYAALKIIQKASDWATRGKIILCTIHQPRNQIWELFDDVLILGAEGRQVYFGPVEEVPGWFGSMGYNVPPNTSVSDYVLDLLNNSFVPSQKADKLERAMSRMASKGALIDPSASHKVEELRRQQSVHVNVPECAARFKASAYYSDILSRIDDAVAVASRSNTPVVKERHHTNWFVTLFYLLSRNGANYVRNPGNLAARVIMTTVVGLLCGAAFRDVTSGVMNNPVFMSNYMVRVLTALLLAGIILTLLPFVSISLFIYDRQFFHKESRAKLYSPSAYFLSNIILEMFANACIGIVFAIIQYFMQNLGQESVKEFRPDHFFIYLAIIVGMANVGCMQSIMFSLLAPNQDVAFVMNCGFTAVAMLTCGLLVPTSVLNADPILSKLQYISTMRYGFRALAANELKSVVFGPVDFTFIGGTKPGKALFMLCNPMFGLELCDIDLQLDSSLLVALFLGMSMISFLALKYLNRE